MRGNRKRRCQKKKEVKTATGRARKWTTGKVAKKKKKKKKRKANAGR